MWCCLEMTGPEIQSSSAGAAIKGFDRVEEAVSRFEPLSGWILLINYRGCRGSFSCLSFSNWEETARLICSGAIRYTIVCLP